MKRLNFLDKFLFFINSVVAVLLITNYLIPYIDPENCPTIAILSLAYPTLLIINIAFVFIWLLKLKPHLLLSAIVISLGYQSIKALFPINDKENTTVSDLSVLSYNVRQFNRYNWIKKPNIKQGICDFINGEKADIVCIQEYKNIDHLNIKLPFKYETKTSSSGFAIYSKFKILNSGSVGFKNTANNAVYVDISLKNKLVRIYNVHLQSFSLDTKKEHYGKLNNKALYHKFQSVFKQQAQQIKQLRQHIKDCPYPTILAGDFNNTAFSWNYKQLTKNHQDAFVAAGSGFGKSYNYFLPFRIDFILPNKSMNVSSFKSYKVKLSDHYPIMAKINLNN